MNILKSFFTKEEIEQPKEVVVSEWKKPEVIIDSAHIKKDIQESFEQVLQQFNLDLSKESEIEKLQDQMETYKSDNEKVYQKIEKLQTLGLTSTPSVKMQLEQLKGDEQRFRNKIQAIQEKINIAEKTKNLIAEYALKYPHFKFVTTEVMIDVMKRYHLALADACFYAKEIPDDSLEIISGFSAEIEESKVEMELVGIPHNGRVYNYEFRKKKKKPETPTDEIVYRLYMTQAAALGDSGEKVFTTITQSKFKMIAPESHFKIPSVDVDRYSSRRYKKEEKIPIAVLDEDTKMYRLNTEAFEELNKHNREVLDPIACLKVEGGYIVMTAWDEEAEIPEIKNQNWN